MNRRFSIEMKTVLGIRKGLLQFADDGDFLHGTLEMLSHTTQIDGHITENGRIDFSGTIITLLKTIPFLAEGIIKDGKMKLSVKNALHTFSVTGIETKFDD